MFMWLRRFPWSDFTGLSSHRFGGHNTNLWLTRRGPSYPSPLWLVYQLETAHTLQEPASRNRGLSGVFCRQPTKTGCQP
jgi:hypothetical protein